VQKVGSAETQQFHGESLNLPDHPLYSCVPVPVCVGCNNKGTQRNFEGLNPPQLPGFPFFLEPDSHMRISCHIVTIAKAIDVILSKYDPDTNFVREKCKVQIKYTSWVDSKLWLNFLIFCVFHIPVERNS